MCDKPVLINFALLFFFLSLLSLDQVTMSEFLICLFSKVIMITVTHYQLRMTHPSNPPVLFIP